MEDHFKNEYELKRSDLENYKKRRDNTNADVNHSEFIKTHHEKIKALKEIEAQLEKIKAMDENESKAKEASKLEERMAKLKKTMFKKASVFKIVSCVPMFFYGCLGFSYVFLGFSFISLDFPKIVLDLFLDFPCFLGFPLRLFIICFS